MTVYLLPFVDIIAWCLMPNHFHIMVFVNSVKLVFDSDEARIHRVTLSHPVSRNSITHSSSSHQD